MMLAGKRTQNYIPNGSATSTPDQAGGSVNARNLMKSHLGGVIFGCKNSTIKECLFKQLFGLPAQHFSFVKNIDPGLPLFLFNYTDRKLHGIFEAAGSGQMNINPYTWTTDGSERTLFPAQVQIRIRLQCQALREDQFKPIILDNYYTQNHFWFELDHAQTSRLMSLLSSVAIAPSTFALQNTEKWRTIIQAPDRREEKERFDPPALEADFPNLYKSNGKVGTSDFARCLDGNRQPLEPCSNKQVVEKDEKDLIYMKLKEMALKFSDPSSSGCVEDTPDMRVANLKLKGILNEQTTSEEKKDEIPAYSSDYPSVVDKLIEGIEELKAFKSEQIHQMYRLEQKLVAAEIEIRQLKDRCMALESMPNPSLTPVDKTVIEPPNPSLAPVDGTVIEPPNGHNLDLAELIFLVGGYDGSSWLSALDAYSPLQDVLTPLSPMNAVRSFASVAELNSELYVFGGGNGLLWYDTVESYDPANNHWNLRPPLNERKGSLAGATLNDKIFALGGGNGVESFSTVEMLDLDVGRWILTQSMLQKRFALAAAEVNGALYAVGGYDGREYLRSVERFDPREHSWTRIGDMNTTRACHSLAVMNEKLYAIGGYDGDTMVPSMEIYDPRLGTWVMGEPMNQARGYLATVVLHDSIYAIGGIRADEGIDIVETVVRYQDGQGWQETNLGAVGGRCYLSAIVLGRD
ncbi:hypothetical protein LguiA_016445 [Lonicera macranthoides]